jgi:glutathione S-transferase
MKLYCGRLSGHSHRARLFLALLGIDYEPVEADLAAGAHKTPEFLGLNRFAEVPVLDDDGVIVPDSNSLLVCGCTRFSGFETPANEDVP